MPRSCRSFNFAKTLDDLDTSKVIGTQFAESLKTMQLSEVARKQIAEAIGTMPRFPTAVTSSGVATVATDAVALAEVDDVAVIVDDAIGSLADMTPEVRRTLALDVALLIGAAIVLASWLQVNAKDPKAVGAAIVFAVTLVRVYWRVTDKL